MSNRAAAMGLDAELAAKAAAKYSTADEASARAYIKKLTGKDIAAGADSVHDALKAGDVLCELANAIRPGSIKKFKVEKMAFKQMQNISFFLDAIRDIGVLPSESFQTVDLYEKQNMGQVVVCILALERRAAGKGVLASNASKALPKSDGTVSMQMGSNKGASQAGMSFGGLRQTGGKAVFAAGQGNGSGGGGIASAPAKATSAPAAATAASSGKSKFCSGCGKPAGAGNFCAGCGNKL